MNFSQIKETSLYVKDLRSSEKFYTDILNLKVIGRSDNRHVFFRAGSSVLLCFNADSTSVDKKLPPHAAKGQIHIAFEVKKGDYETVKKRLSAKGVKIEHEHSWQEGVRSFYFRDPDNNLIEIVPQGMWDDQNDE